MSLKYNRGMACSIAKQSCSAAITDRSATNPREMYWNLKKNLEESTKKYNTDKQSVFSVFFFFTTTDRKLRELSCRYLLKAALGKYLLRAFIYLYS